MKRIYEFGDEEPDLVKIRRQADVIERYLARQRAKRRSTAGNIIALSLLALVACFSLWRFLNGL